MKLRNGMAVATLAIAVLLLGYGARVMLAAYSDIIHLSVFAQTHNSPIGIDFLEPTVGTGRLLATVGYCGGTCPSTVDDFETLAEDATPGTYTNLIGLIGEIKVATSRPGSPCSQFPDGTVFAGNGQVGGLLKIEPGPTIDLSWVTLPLETAHIRGSLYVDRSCVYGGDLIVATGNDQADSPGEPINDGSIWRVNKNGIATRVVQIGRHLEGVVTVPDDPVKYGLLAGRILAGDEDIPGPPFNQYGSSGRIWAVKPGDPNPIITIGAAYGSYPNIQVGFPLHPEDLDLIPRPRPGRLLDGNLFAIDFTNSVILRAPASDFADKCGDILVTQEFPSGDPTTSLPSGFSTLRFDGTNYVVTPLQNKGSATVGHFEHVAFWGGQGCASGPFQTVTQGGWGAPAHGNNPGTILNAYFATSPPPVVIGGGCIGAKTLTFNSADAIRAFLPAGGPPKALGASDIDPTTSAAGVFAGQVLALQLNVTLSNAGLGAFVLPSGPAAGKTVNQVLADANKALGGCGLPSYAASISALNDIVDTINNMFD